MQVLVVGRTLVLSYKKSVDALPYMAWLSFSLGDKSVCAVGVEIWKCLRVATASGVKE